MAVSLFLVSEPVVLVYFWPNWHASCLVPSPHYCERPMRFGSRGPSENPSRSSRIRHRNALTEKAREEAVLGLGRRASKLKGKRFPVRFCFCFSHSGLVV